MATSLKRVNTLSLTSILIFSGVVGCSKSSHSSNNSGAASNPALVTCSNLSVFMIADAAAIRETVKGAEDGLFSGTGLRRSQVAITEKNAQGNSANVQTIARNLVESKAKIFIVLGTSATITLRQMDKSRPIITLGMADPVGAGVVHSLEKPGTNVTGSTDYLDPAAQLQQLLQVKPVARRIGTVYDPSQPNAVKWVRDLSAAAKTTGVQIIAVTATRSGDIGVAARSLVGRVDAIMIGNDANTLAGVPAIAATAQQAKIPLYLNGGDPKTPGVFATLGPSYYEVGRLAGLNAAKVCNGGSPGSIPFATPKTVTWGINSQTLARLKLSVRRSQSVEGIAEVIGSTS